MTSLAPLPAEAPGARPKLARKVRLKLDRHSGEHWLIYPECGLRLNQSAARIAQLCRGELQVPALVEQLAANAGGVSRERIEREVRDFLQVLSERGLIEWVT
jgi:coenzyme PQQ biosynthesis protein PqqD